MTENYGGKCLDGSSPSIYIKQPKYQVDPKKFIFYFQGGAWCFQNSYDKVLQDCYDRSKHKNTGSSNRLTSTKNFQGIFSADKIQNPFFYDYTIIHVNYCDGAGHQGSVEEPLYLKNSDKKVWFRGANNTMTVLNYAKEILKMHQAETVIVAGSSAGGLAAYTWIDYIADDLQQLNPNINVFGIMGAGMFMDYPNFKTGEHSFFNQMKNLLKITNKNTNYVNKKCQKAYKKEPWKCMFAEYLSEFIKSDMILIQSGYDSYQIPFVLEIECVGRTLQKNYLNDCTRQEKEYIQKFNKDFNDKVKLIQTKKKNISNYIVSCVCHDYLQKEIFYDPKSAVPNNSGNTAAFVSGIFANGVRPINLIDEVQWPDNENCNSY